MPEPFDDFLPDQVEARESDLSSPLESGLAQGIFTLIRSRKNNIAFVKTLAFNLENTTGSDINAELQLLYYENVKDDKGFLEQGVDGDQRGRIIVRKNIPSNDGTDIRLQEFGAINELMLKPDATLAFSLGATGSAGDLELDVSIIWHEYFTERFR
jgi:hypothetical protein